MVIGGVLNDLYGWRTAFLFVAIPGILMAIILPFIIKDPRARADAPVDVNQKPGIAFTTAMAEIMQSRGFVMLMIAASVTAFLSYGKTVWATILFIRSFGLSPGEAGATLGIVIGLAGVFGTWLGGALADRFGARDKRHILTAPAIGMTIAAPILFLAYNMTDWRIALALMVIPTILNSMYYGPTYACVQGLVRPEARATASAMMLFAQNLIGLGLGPLLFGMLSDALKPIAGPESVRWVLFGAAWLGLIPAFFFWQSSLRLKAELKTG
jgi:predicted MFS family arabinose efflux permease